MGWGEHSLTTTGVHPDIHSQKVTGQASKLGLGQPVNADLISFIPIVSTVADFVDHINDEPLEKDKRLRYTASILSGEVHIAECPGKETVNLTVSLKMRGAAAGHADYENQVVTSTAIKGALSLLPSGTLEQVGASTYVEKYVLDQLVLGLMADDVLCLSLDSRFKAYSEVSAGLGEGSFYSVDDALLWSPESSDFEYGTMNTGKILPSAWGISKWLSKSTGMTDHLEASTIRQNNGTFTQVLSVEPGSDIPISILMRTYAETAGFAGAEARVDAFSLTVSSNDYADGASLVIESDPDWSFPKCSAGDPFVDRSNMLSCAVSPELTLGDVEVVDSIGGVTANEGTGMVLVRCAEPGGMIIPITLPNADDKELHLSLALLLERILLTEEYAEVEIGLTSQTQHQVLWKMNFEECDFEDIPSISEEFSLYSDMLELQLDVSAFEAGQAFLTVAGYSDALDCNVGFLAQGLEVVPEPATLGLLVIGGMGLLRRRQRR